MEEERGVLSVEWRGVVDATGGIWVDGIGIGIE